MISLSKFQYFFIPVLLCILPGLSLFSLGGLEQGLITASVCVRPLSGEWSQAFFRVLHGRAGHKEHNWNRWDSGRTQDSCPLYEGSQAVERVCPPALSWRSSLANLHYSVIICIVSLLGVYPLLKEDDLLSSGCWWN